MAKNWMEFRAAEFKDLDPMRTIAVLPTAAIEQHGPHLPVGTDALIGEGMLAESRRIIPEDMDVRILPLQAIGKSNEHIWSVGTLSLTVGAALSSWAEIGLSASRSGIRKIVIANSHGGNVDIVSILAREFRVQAGMLAVKCQWGSFGHPEGMYSADELKYGIHGGDVETSLMLHFRPDLVDMSAARDFRSSAESEPVSPVGPLSYGWIAKDLNADGVVGNASNASAAKGAATAAHQAAGFVELLRQVEKLPLDKFDPATRPQNERKESIRQVRQISTSRH
ncbi:MAG: creatininase family protein [Albidovulum sp.]|nr:creatininase family protein [Albidovulum sp.]